MPVPKRLDPWTAAQADSAAHRNQAVDVLNQITPMHGANGVVVSTSASGTTIGLSELAQQIFGFSLGTITNTGPAGQTDYYDSRYWVRLASYPVLAADTAIVASSLNAWDDAKDANGAVYESKLVTATNMAETSEGSHALFTDETQVVQIFRIHAEGVPNWVFSLAPCRAMFVRITGTETGGGVYKGFRLRRTSDIAATTAVTSSDFIDVGSEIQIRNYDEQGILGHTSHILSGTVFRFPGTYIRTNTDGKQVWGIFGHEFDACA